ncbi:hypothetical protein E3P94_01212 [Wallemia ichthyophaga]|nr:hypothetical protein E3P98_00986 [Wallemia ichthyophaga]TIB02020.1 hypothetical protein E3P95_01080 [Wallemia ichthyophaga]TIB02937.1 hypothetical protein E3P94_01212 [Wallemia ichthyophaga]
MFCFDWASVLAGFQPDFYIVSIQSRNGVMRASVFVVVELFIVVFALSILYTVLPAHKEPFFRPADVMESYKVNNELFRAPYNEVYPPPRSFEEPDFGLLTSSPPSHYPCSSDNAPRLFIGIFSTPDPSATARRALIRSLLSQTFEAVGNAVLEYKFVVGTSEHDSQNNALAQEHSVHKDILTLPTSENMNSGKSYAYFRALLEMHKRDPAFTPQFVAKCDDDTLLVVPAVLNSLSGLQCDQNVYWGTSAGRSNHFPEYFRGLAYILSWPLVGWIGGSDVGTLHQHGIEDARTGQWMQMLPYLSPSESVRRVDNKWNMGDWNQLSITQDTLALHWLKMDDWYRTQAALIDEAWDLTNGAWVWRGLPSQEEENRRKEMHRVAVVEKAMVREASEKSGVLFDDAEYNRLHPEGFTVF